MVRSKKWLIRSGALSLVAGSTLVVGVACAGATDVSGLESQVTELQGQVTALQGTVDTAVAALGNLGGDGQTGAPSGPAPPRPANPHTPRTAPPSAALVATPAATSGGDAENRLDTIIERGRVICGVQAGTPGFGTAERVGHDADYCRAIAAAVFGVVTEGEGGTLEFISATGDNRFTLLSEGDIDVLVRTTTWTSGRDSNLGAQFTQTTFFDQAGLMVAPDVASRVVNANDLDGVTICSRSGTSTLDAISDLVDQTGITINTQTSDDDAVLVQQYSSGTCDAFASDESQLAGIRSALPGDLRNSVILSAAQWTLEDGTQLERAKEPLGPSVHADAGAEWFDLVQWTNYGLITAEELGITQSNVRSLAANVDSLTPSGRRLLGVGGTQGDNGFTFNDKVTGGQQWFQNVIAAVGNFGEIYDANLGEDGLGLDRACTAQALWNTGEDTAFGSAVWQDCDGDGTISQQENRGLITAPRYSG